MILVNMMYILDLHSSQLRNNMYKVRLTGTQKDIQKVLDCTKVCEYAIDRNNNSFTLYLREIPPYINLYENILYVQLGRFRELGELEF